MATPRVTIDGLPEQTTIETDNYVIVQDTGTTKKMLLSKILDSTPTQLTAHIAQATDAHDASAVSATPAGTGVDASTVQGQLGQVASLIAALDARVTALETP
jgi:hypothetical protein